MGALITPFVAQVLIRTSQVAAASTYGVVALIAAIACCMLPIETKGRDMPDTTTAQKKARKKPRQPDPVREFDNPINFDPTHSQ